MAASSDVSPVDTSSELKPESQTPALERRESLLDEVEEKVTSVWQTLKEKASEEDLKYAEQESELYHGEPLSSREEILAWYAYDWANSPMFNVMIGLIIPIFLPALARQYGCEEEAAHGCDVNFVPIHGDSALYVYMGSWKLKPESFTFTMISLSGAMQAVAYITVGALADYSSYQYYLFRVCTLIASLMPIAFVFISDPKLYSFAGWWIALQIVFFGLALIFYNAYLPKIVENHWNVRKAVRQKKSTEKVCALKQQLSDDISQYGYACGYFGSLFMTIIAVVVLVVTETQEYEQLTGYGSTSGAAFNEEWLKPVDAVYMRFDAENLVQIQLSFVGIDIDGDIYGASNADNLTLQSYEVPEDEDYINQIEYWLNTNGQIKAMRFSTQSGVSSEIYSNSSSLSAAADQSASAEDAEHYVWAGYVVYVADNKVSGMDLVMLNQETGQFQSLRGIHIISLLVVIWWNGFQFLCFRYFQRRDGPPLPAGSSPLTFGTKQFWNSLKTATTYPNMFRYLIAWFCFSDGLNTLSTAAVIFATTELGMNSAEAAILILEALIFGSFGGVVFLWIQRKFRWDAKHMLLIHITTFALLSVYSMFGLIPGCPFGLVTKTEIWIYVFFYGMNWGSIQSYARSVFAYLVPVGRESQMFALYEITDKGSSWMGPMFVGLITNVASIRWGMFYVALFFLVSVPLLVFGVNLVEGMKEAGRWQLIDKDDPNLAGIVEEAKEEEPQKEKEKEKGDENENDGNTGNGAETEEKPQTEETEMVSTNGTVDSGDADNEEPENNNYDNPKVKIKVTSLDEEEQSKQKADDENEMQNEDEDEEVGDAANENENENEQKERVQSDEEEDDSHARLVENTDADDENAANGTIDAPEPIEQVNSSSSVSERDDMTVLEEINAEVMQEEHQ
eukprot:CAMPEP_0197030608 /NCGR_PEP_ID=MMETSP1384-20130603/9811_1 /TAXON_ID=29189 /ORGANISM="Ammonia sp." /LENGTH=904 /DNA_ID=CAMNT_0042459993 /DNA_START=23 /DNA_END=2737 /DNA_ORIENTATION=+